MAMICMVNRTAVARLSEQQEQIVHPTMNISDFYTKEAAISPVNGSEIISTMAPARHKRQLVEEDKCSGPFVKATKGAEKYNGELVISKADQGLIFTSFYAGGLAIVIPGSYLCDRFGAKKVVLIGAMVNVIGTFITPSVAKFFGAWALILLRFIMGCGQGVLVPCMNVLIAHWFPLAEKSTAIAIATTGNQFSVIVAMFATAELCQIIGWPFAFYTYGVVGLMFCLIWLLWVYDTPAKAKKISTNEINFIRGGGPKSDGKINPKLVPWRSILSSMVVWAIALSSFSQNFMTVGIVTYIPAYYQSVLRMDLTSNGVMSALPFIIQLLTKILFAAIADTLKARKLMSHTSVTKLFNLIGSIGSGISILLLTFCDCYSAVWAILLINAAVGLSSGFIPGYNTSIVCVAPRFTSSVASFSRLLGQIASVASPYMIGFVVKKGTREEWQFSFYVISFILIASGILFQFYGSASIQPWAKQEIKEVTIESVKEDTAAFLPKPEVET
uniref:Major facilitator superfamily (MFS) profile domain-containing protein n=1 Tax=Acrobeloides nanus TaxID=290746 RepID=A0A914DR20_9BILA